MSRKRVIILSLVFILLTSGSILLYFLAINRAEINLEQLVESQSNGTLQFKVEKVRFNVFHLRFDFQKPELRTIDTLNTVSGYHVKADRIIIDSESLISVLSGKQIVIDSVLVQSPGIEVIKYKEGPHNKISLPDEMDKVYQSLESILKILNLNYLHIHDAKLTVTDRLKPENLPIQLSNINLTVDNISEDQKPGKNKFLYADRILLEIFDEEILFPDGYHGIKFKSLKIGTRSQRISIDSCFIYANANDSSSVEFNVFIDSLRVSKLDFNLMVKENILKFDSAQCINPEIDIMLHLKDNRKITQLPGNEFFNRDSIDQKIKTVLGNLDIGYLGVKNAKINFRTEKNNRNYIFSSENDNFSISKIIVSDKKDVPVQLGQFEIEVRNYARYSPDSLYVGQFDRISIKDEKVQLINLRINPSLKNKDPLRKEIKMQAFELDNINWPVLLYENRIEAGHASLIKPEVRMVLPKSANNQGEKVKTNPFTVLSQYHDKLRIGEFFIEDGELDFEVLNGPRFSMSHCYAGINVGKLLDSKNEIGLINAFDNLSFSTGVFSNSLADFSLTNGVFSRQNSLFQFEQMKEISADQSQSITINGLKMSGIVLNSLNDISLAGLTWKSADILVQIDQGNDTISQTKKPSVGFKLVINKISGGPINFSLKSENLEASTQFNKISTAKIILESGKKPIIKELNMDGQTIQFNQKNNLQGSLGDFQIVDKQISTINNVKVELPLHGEMLSIVIPRLTFSADINQLLDGKINADFIELHHPVISFSKMEENDNITHSSKKSDNGLPLIDIKRITIDQPELVNLPDAMETRMQFNSGSSKWDILGVVTKMETLQIESFHISIKQPKYQNEKLQLIATGKEEIDLLGSSIIYHPENQQSENRWSFIIDALKISGLHLNLLKQENIQQTIILNNIKLENLAVNDSSFRNKNNFLLQNDRFSISNGDIQFENENVSLEVFNLALTKAANILSMDSLAFYPLSDRDAFMKTKDFQITHNQLFTGKINVNGIDFNQLVQDSVLYAKKVSLNDLNFLVYKDKRLPFKHGVEKPMLTDLLLGIKPEINVDSVILKNGFIEYEEFNDKTKQFGKITFDKIRGVITNFKTFNPAISDSLKFNLYARLLDTADLRIKYKQSYTDSLSGFNLKLIVSSFDLTALNPILRTFASAELKSGYLDTIRMSVIGRKHVAFGVMKMYYNHLNAVILKRGTEDTKTVVTKSVSFITNRIVHTKNRYGTGEVYAERDPEKGFVNYWVKIVIGGVFTNTGVRTNKKQERKYDKAIEKYKVPPIPNIPVDY